MAIIIKAKTHYECKQVRGNMETIGNVTLNYDYYTDGDIYSDGEEIENKLLEIAKDKKNIDSLLYETNIFAEYYHFSPQRQFIVEGMDIRKSDTVLEIGSGCGAVTGALARKAKNVDCIELSKRRSLINAHQNRENDNVQIYVANYENVQIEKKYDVITLIGVFEYAAHYIHSDNPYEDFLNNVLGKIKSKGKIYIAIENKFGAKYFAGCKEDHTGRVCDGIEGYQTNSKVRTFSYYEWIELLKKCGCSNYRFMYPYPDYKFPTEIYSDDFLPTNSGDLKKASDYSQKRRVFFDEENFIHNLYIEKEFRIFSNSFLIEITK